MTHTLSRVAFILVLTLSLASCTSSRTVVYSGGSILGASSFPYSPKAQESEKGEHSVGVQYGIAPIEYYTPDENNHFGQLNYTYSYRWKHFYSNVNLVAGGGNYNFRNTDLNMDESHYGYLQGGLELGAYTEFGDFTWRYIQLRGGIGSEFGSYVGKLKTGQDELDERFPDEDVNLIYYGPMMVSLSLSTELEYSLNRYSNVGIQVGSYQENFAYALGGCLFYEYKQFGIYVGSSIAPVAQVYNVGMYYRL